MGYKLGMGCIFPSLYKSKMGSKSKKRSHYHDAIDLVLGKGRTKIQISQIYSILRTCLHWFLGEIDRAHHCPSVSPFNFHRFSKILCNSHEFGEGTEAAEWL